MDRMLQDKLNIGFTRDERILLWDLVGREIDKLKHDGDSDWAQHRLQQLKLIEVLIVG